MSYFDEATRERFMPYIIETSAGVDRTLLTCLIDAYDEEPERVVLHLSPKIAPIKAAIFPWSSATACRRSPNESPPPPAHFKVFYDESGSIAALPPPG